MSMSCKKCLKKHSRDWQGREKMKKSIHIDMVLFDYRNTFSCLSFRTFYSNPNTKAVKTKQNKTHQTQEKGLRATMVINTISYVWVFICFNWMEYSLVFVLRFRISNAHQFLRFSCVVLPFHHQCFFSAFVAWIFVIVQQNNTDNYVSIHQTMLFFFSFSEESSCKAILFFHYLIIITEIVSELPRVTKDITR